MENIVPYAQVLILTKVLFCQESGTVRKVKSVYQN